MRTSNLNKTTLFAVLGLIAAFASTPVKAQGWAGGGGGGPGTWAYNGNGGVTFQSQGGPAYGGPYGGNTRFYSQQGYGGRGYYGGGGQGGYRGGGAMVGGGHGGGMRYGGGMRFRRH